MATPKPRVRVPATAKKGEIIEIKTLIAHDMEMGTRKGADGKVIPRKIIKQFVCTFNGKDLFKADWQPGISANPYMAFFAKVTESGTFDFAWHDDDGSIYKTSSKIEVS
ncbi:MAG: thiosulfate oxidation carrier complex protein SoxZ [Rhodospirillaceae bacterium]|nr:thiosulfate oxidation carrier complex protein SoxZ [Rhodospirillaceae bacterium]